MITLFGLLVSLVLDSVRFIEVDVPGFDRDPPAAESAAQFYDEKGLSVERQ